MADQSEPEFPTDDSPATPPGRDPETGESEREPAETGEPEPEFPG